MDESALETVLSGWSGEHTVLAYDHRSGAWLIIAIHSTRRGPGIGGTRMGSYPTLASAVADALALAAAMSYKFAVARFPAGGAKAVIALPATFDPGGRAGLLERYGQLIKQLRGGFITGPDSGTSIEDMEIIARTGAPYVAARPAQTGGSGDSGPPTAMGVYYGIQATLGQLYASAELEQRRIVVQGAGGVGRPLIELLVAAGAEVVVSDPNEQLTQAIVAHYPVQLVAPADIYAVECDIFAPCAVGGILNPSTIPQLRCRAIAGAANNQLDGPEAADQLQQRGILYAPDFVINGGGAMSITGRIMLGWSLAEADQWLSRIRTTLQQVFAEALALNITPEHAARRRAERELTD